MHLDISILYDLIVLLIAKGNNSKMKTLCNMVKNLFMENKTQIVKHDETIINIYFKIINEILNLEEVQDPSSDTNYKELVSTIISKYIPENADEEEYVLLKNLLNKLIKNNFTEEYIKNVETRIKNILSWFKILDYAKKIYYHLNRVDIYTEPTIQNSVFEELKGVINELSEFTNNSEIIETPRPNPVESIDLSDKKSIKQAFLEYKRLRKTNLVKLGLQGLNKMNGKRKGFVLGEMVMFCALPYNFKTNMLLYCLKWLSKYNKFEDIKNPLILFISLENKANNNLMWLFEKIFYVLYNQFPPDTLSDKEVIDIIYDFFNKGNANVRIERYDPAEFGFEEFASTISYFKSKGYTPVSVLLDYAMLMKKPSNEPLHSSVRTLLNQLCNFCRNENFLLLTAHQLNRDAAKLASVMTNPVKKFNESHLAYSMDAAREPDILIFQHIERNEDGIPFLTLNLYKNRYVQDVPERSKFIAYRLYEYGLKDDLEGKFEGVRDIFKYKADDIPTQSNNDILDF